jgi:hypothetical protein
MSSSSSSRKSIVDEYINLLNEKCEKQMPSVVCSSGKVGDNMIIPTIVEPTCLLKYNYSIVQLKSISKIYKLKISGTKKELTNRIYVFLKLSHHIIKIQKVFRGHMQRELNILHGPAYLIKNRQLCTNDRDFLSDDLIIEIPNNQLFSYTDIDNFIYGFDVISLYNLILKSDGRIKNPYNRNIINNSIICNFKKMIRLSNALKKNITIKIEEDIVSQEKIIELKVLQIFQSINALGNYSDGQWFLSLNRALLIKFSRDLADIWYYRAQITSETKKLICPQGDPFNTFNFNYLMQETNLDKLRLYILQLLDKLINSGVNQDNKALGACYVLGALTIVNENAATALPWLYQSFSYF